MRYAVDLVVLSVVFGIAMMVFEDALSALLAGIILAGATDALIWDADQE